MRGMHFDPGGMGRRLQKVVLLHHTTLNEVGIRAGISSGQMSKLARGALQGVRVDTVVRLRAALGVRLEWLVLGTGEMYPNGVKRPASPPARNGSR